MECLRWRGPTGWVYLDSADLNFSNRPVRTRMPGGVAGARPDGRPLCRFRRTQKEPKGPRPSVRPSLRSGSLVPVPLRGPAVTGHPWPNTAIPASMPGCPLRRTSSRPPEGAGRSKAFPAEAADRPACLVAVCARSVAADEPCEAAFGLVRHCDEAVVKSASTVSQAYRVPRCYDRFAIDRSLVLLVNCYDAG